ncbi:phosphotransacetylase family protein [Halorubrum ezzemoulense]|uniref:Phosphotransacetylase family protein n=1 Tax=Halorubrum ezzemoulense TaxID=337243 RepID=A0A256JEM5_HALEZ|nr:MULTISPECIES: phosphotransacetylase family protein [Halorubrum]MDB2224036.1 phosphotransacetylase family protein [Halorubrum ezzemoulense]MDB2236178.1 phosphotransacetylase family protein [Halorubrum ezzemoulense]MDB2241461.1 phosphotransacetylase family protein [Halorubrum ezzemoulense]MDB2245163.1 phosphotransacetylase family protein [Halorubrum ezzemoulense]MDB2248534.1 phosphotransacetylase family protein [Halorubrum ezzemoulense]
MTDTPTTLVTATGDSAGKTAITVALARLAADQDSSVGYMKPKGTRLQSNVGKTLDQDPMLAREVLGLDAEMHQMEPVVYSPTFVEGAIRGTEDSEALRDRIREEYDDIAADHDQVFVEGGGSWTTGGVVDLTDVDVAELLDANVVLVAEYGSPNDLDDVLAAADAFGDRLAGVVFNKVSDDAFESLDQDGIPFLESKGVTVFGALPYEKELAGVTVGELADELGAELLTDASTDAFVERFLVGAMGGDEALRYFRRARDAAVITGGDRADVQTAALDASGVACLVLTGGHRPSGAVLGKAADAGTPVLAVNTDTVTAIDRAEEVVRGGRTRDVRTVDRMAELLADNVDVDALV